MRITRAGSILSYLTTDARTDTRTGVSSILDYATTNTRTDRTSHQNPSTPKEQLDVKQNELRDLRRQIAQKEAEVLEKQRALELAQKSEEGFVGGILSIFHSEIASRTLDLQEDLKQLEELKRRLKEVEREIRELLRELQQAAEPVHEDELDRSFVVDKSDASFRAGVNKALLNFQQPPGSFDAELFRRSRFIRE